MVTFAQAQERAEEWINGDVPSYQHREVRVREFELGFVVWAEDREDGPRSDGGAQRLVIARDSGEATLWPSLPVGEVIRRYEEEYGREGAAPEPAPAPAARVDLNQTSFLLTPPEWLQDAADKLGIPDRRESRGGAQRDAQPRDAEPLGAEPRDAVSGPDGPEDAVPGPAAPAGGSALPETQAGIPAGAADAPGAPGAAVPGGTPGAVPGAALSGSPGVPAGATPWAGTDTNADAGEDRSVPLPETVFAPPLSGVDDEVPQAVVPEAKTALIQGGSRLPPTAIAPALNDPGSQGAQGAAAGAAGGPGAPGMPGAQAAPAAPGAPGTPPPPSVPPVPGAPIPGAPQGSTPPPAPPGSMPPPAPPGSMPPPAPPGSTPPPAPPGSTPPPVPGAPSYGYPQAGGAQPMPSDPGDIADAATSKAAPPPRRGRGGGATPPPPPGAPGTPGARPGSTPPPAPAPGTPPGGAYVPTQLVSALGPDGPGGPAGPGAPQPPGAPNTPGGTPPGGVHHAATMLADPSQMGPGAPQPPGPPGVPGPPQPPGVPGAPGAPGAVHHAETMLAAPPVGAPGVPPPPQAPGVPGAPGMPPGAPQPMPPAPGRPLPGQPVPGQPMPGAQPPAYGYPQQGQPTVGPGYQAVLRYRAQDGSEQQLIRRSAPGTPHPEWQIFHELRAMNVPPDQVLELHTELESCELPGAYCARMIREQWPQARITSIAPYGTDHASRQQGMRQLLAHQGELHQVADGPARPAPVRAPLPPVQPVPPVPPEAVAQELAAAFGPGVFRFEQAAVSRQGVPPIVAHTLVVAGLPVDMGPFFWAQAQPGRPVPTLAELAQERGVQPAADAGSYLVMGSDFGKAICVQYGTANIVAVPVEAGPGGAPVPPQFVNTGLPEFARCMALLGRMWRLRFGLNQEQAGRWTVDFQAQLAALDPAALGSPESWWSVLLEQMWDGLL
ncbi:SUKH-4 family immunity protein [Streptomyces sp.]|uniref:SUKH-4 family immunity protein n=1 Tax=Streptomyces sp. TaxID=1931 RepID=UPI002D542450|nr:SUKH-4 family immunity protein [Streptomyces sp.]HZF91268.1 SUKH-4 family immunity protein [Streptomyces sp.]